MRRLKNGHEVAVIDCCTMYAYNVCFEEFALEVYGSEFPFGKFSAANMKDGGYVQGRFTSMQKSFTRYWGELDRQHRAKFVAAAVVKYGSECGLEVFLELDDENLEDDTKGRVN